MARGPQRSDNVFLAFGAPWHALASLLPTAVQLGFLILVGLAVRFVAERSVVGPRAPLVIAGLVVVLVGWFGPGARRVRRGGEVMLGSLRRYRKVGWALAALLMAAAWAAGMWWESFGTTWWPSDTPPWP